MDIKNMGPGKGRRGLFGLPAAKRLSYLAIVFTLTAGIVAVPTLFLAFGEGAGEDAGDRMILGLDVPNYADGAHLRVSATEREWIRNHKLEIRWERVQQDRGAFNWDYYDKQINAILSDGSQSILLLVGGPVPGWARDMSYGRFANKAPPADLNDWYVFCAETAKRYGGVADYYEIWNEPGWDRDGEAMRLFGVYHFGGQVETDYLPLLRSAYAAIKEHDTSSVVICGALMETLDGRPEAGTGLYTSMFDDSRKLFTDISVAVDADGPVAAERCADFQYWAGQPEAPGGESAEPARNEWYFAEGSTRDGLTTWLVLENTGAEDASITLAFYREDGSAGNSQFALKAGSRLTLDIRQGSPDAGQSDPGSGDVGVAVLSDRPIKAERSMYFDYDGNSTASGAPSPTAPQGTQWTLSAGSREYRVRERICFLNPGAEEAAVTVAYRDPYGASTSTRLQVPAGSRRTVSVGDYGIWSAGNREVEDSSVIVSSSRPVVAERSLMLDYAGNWRGSSTSRGSSSPSSLWYFAGEDAGYSLGETVRLTNSGGRPVRADVRFTMQGLQLSETALGVPAGSSTGIDVNAAMGFNASCDMIGVHNYKRPENWGLHYSALVQAFRSMGVNKEVAVTETGWPHYQDDDPDAFSIQQQTDAIGSQGIGSLREAGCRKIWIYKDLDERPGRSWDKRYFGLFAYDGSPHPSWQEYKEWQLSAPSYPRLPTSLP